MTITDQSGTLLGTGTASENIPVEGATETPYDCVFDFSVPDVPDNATFYTVTTALGKTSFTHAQMEASHWRADLQITSPS